MSAPSGRHAVVAIAALDLRRAADHRSELVSQLLLGEIVRTAGPPARGGWRRVRSEADGSRGWARDWGLVPASAARLAAWRSRARYRVTAPVAWVHAHPGHGISAGPLFLGSRLVVGPRRGAHRHVEMPDGRRGWVEAGALAPARAPGPGLAERVFSLLGTPYLWGGRTPAGYDCSGFVQMVLAERGVSLPRDSHDQLRACRALPGGTAPGPGDLAFFASAGRRVSHVALMLGPSLFAHARGWVRLGSFDPDNPLWDKNLSGQLRGFGMPGPPRAPRRAVGA